MEFDLSRYEYDPLFAECTSAVLRECEQGLGVTLPDDYCDFLAHTNGVLFASPLEAPMLAPPDSEPLWFDVLFGVSCEPRVNYDIRYEMFLKQFERRLPLGFVAVARLYGGGDAALAMSCAGSDRGSVYLWDTGGAPVHVENPQPSREELYLVACSFTDFYQSWRAAR